VSLAAILAAWASGGSGAVAEANQITLEYDCLEIHGDEWRDGLVNVVVAEV
jgi:hypothetical protein